MKQAMKRMGIQQVDVPAQEVVIRSGDKEIVFQNPQVAKVNMMGQETFQIVGDYIEREVDTTPEITDDDVKVVVEQAECSEEQARNSLEETKGDIAEAILRLKQE